MADKDVTEPNQSDDPERPEDKPLVTDNSRRPKRKGSAEVAKKDHATAKQSSHKGETKRRVGPTTFVQQSIAELKKVVWPTSEQLWQYFTVVLIFVLIIIAYVSGLDTLFGWLVLKLLG